MRDAHARSREEAVVLQRTWSESNPADYALRNVSRQRRSNIRREFGDEMMAFFNSDAFHDAGASCLKKLFVSQLFRPAGQAAHFALTSQTAPENSSRVTEQ